MNGKLLSAVCATLVVIVILATVLVPMCQPETKTYDNDGGLGVEYTTDAVAMTGSESGGKITIGTDTFSAYTSRIFMGWDTGYLQTYSANMVNYCHDGSQNALYYPTWEVSDHTITITYYTSDSKTATATQTATFSWLFYPSTSPDHKIIYLSGTSKDIYFNDASDFKAFGRANSHCVIWTGSTATDMGINESVNFESAMHVVDGMSKLSVISVSTSSGATADFGLTDMANPLAVLAPVKATGMTTMGATMSPLLAMIPLMVIAMLVIAIAKIALVRNDS